MPPELPYFRNGDCIMTNIPPNASIIGSIMQSQISSSETAKSQDARRNQRARESKELARLSEQQQDEVEDTEQTDEAIVRREGERQRDGQDARDTYEQHQKSTTQNLYSPDGIVEAEAELPPQPVQKQAGKENENPPEHIDLTG